MTPVNNVQAEPILEATDSGAYEVLESSVIDYEPPNTEMQPERLLFLRQHYDIFLSHGSRSNDGKVLSGEKEFVEKLVTLLKGEKFSKTVFVDYIDNIPKTLHRMRVAIARSKYGVLICSPRYLERYLVPNLEPIPEEADYFINRESRGVICSMPILLNISESKFYDSFSGFTGKFRIDSEYGSPILTLDQIVENTANKIMDRIIELEAS